MTDAITRCTLQQFKNRVNTLIKLSNADIWFSFLAHEVERSLLTAGLMVQAPAAAWGDHWLKGRESFPQGDQ